MKASSRTALAVAAILACSRALAATSAVATPLEGAPPARAEHARGTGTVVYATAGRAYLDVGAADGLAPGATIVARRGRDRAVRCAVDLVADRASSCPSPGLRAGDAVAFQAGPAPAEPKLLPAVAGEDELVRRAAALQGAPAPPLVEFKGAAPGAPPPGPGVRRAQRLSGEVGWAQWSSTDVSGLGAASLDVALRGVEVGRGVLVDIAARAERWVPAANPRFRANQDTRFYLWQAQLTAPLSRATFAAGRVMPYTIPGGTVFDGATASFRAGPAEIGAFGGVVPQPDTLAPTADRSTGGTFWSVSRSFAGGGGLRQDGRLAVVRSPELGTRFEATVAADAWLRAAYASGQAQFGLGGNAQAPGHLDAARADLSAHLGRGFSIGGGYRHSGLTWPDPYGTLEPALFPGRSDGANGWVSWDVWIVRLGGTGGFSRDQRSGMDRTWGGPEVGIPRLLGHWGGFSAGYLEERGWAYGRSAWGQLAIQAGWRWRFVARGTWTHTSSAVVDADEVGVVASGSADLGRGFGIRASVLSRTAVTSQGSTGSAPAGITGIASLYGGY